MVMERPEFCCIEPQVDELPGHRYEGEADRCALDGLFFSDPNTASRPSKEN